MAKHGVDGAAVVIDIEPVAHILTLSVDGQGNAFEYIVEYERDEFFGELGGAVVVGATGYVDGESEGFAVGLREHVGACFGCRVWRTGRKRSGFLEELFSERLEIFASGGNASGFFVEYEGNRGIEIAGERAIYLVGADLKEFFAVAVSGLPVFGLSIEPVPTRRLKKSVCAEHIRFDERAWIFYASVYMAFRSEIHHEIRIGFFHHAVYRRFVTDVAFYEPYVWQRKFGFYSFEIPGICKVVEYSHVNIVTPFIEDVFYEIGPYETGSSGNKIFFHHK